MDPAVRRVEFFAQLLRGLQDLGLAHAERHGHLVHTDRLAAGEEDRLHGAEQFFLFQIIHLR